MKRFEASFANVNKRLRLINCIGEGTFYAVHKAEDLLYDQYDNAWDLDAEKEDLDGQSSHK